MDFTIKNRGRRTSIERFEKDLIELGLLRIGSIKKNDLKETNIKDFIINFIKTYNINHGTYNILTKSIQCDRGRRRSSGDIFRVCKYYYPNCSFIEVLKTIDTIMFGKYSIKSSICTTIWKRVYNKAFVFGKEEVPCFAYSTDMKDEFGRFPGDYLKIK